LNEGYFLSVPSDYLWLNQGTVVIKDIDKGDIVLAVKFKPFEKMPQEEYKEYEKLTSTLIKMKKGASLVTCNATQRRGHMYALG